LTHSDQFFSSVDAPGVFGNIGPRIAADEVEAVRALRARDGRTGRGLADPGGGVSGSCMAEPPQPPDKPFKTPTHDP
jgi:hypothetical protein